MLGTTISLAVYGTTQYTTQLDGGLNLEGARTACQKFGSNWKETYTTDGSIVCSTVPFTKVCNKCDSWRLLVWTDGAYEVRKNDNYNTWEKAATSAGHYYCGHNPCKGGDLTYGGTWQ